MWVDYDGYAHIEDQYDPTTWAEYPENQKDVDWSATDEYRREQEELTWR